jgi:hypothetical protein
MKKIAGAGMIWLLSAGLLAAQSPGFGPCSQTVGWERIRVTPEDLSDAPGTILVITNRSYTPGPAGTELFPNDIAEYRKVSYFLAACEGGSWNLRQVEDLFSGLRAIDRGGDFLLFVHGHGKTMPPVLTRANQIRERYGVSVVVFDWPSFHSNFNKSLSRVRRCGENYYNLLLQLKHYRDLEMEEGQHLSMLLHSLGNYFLTHLVVNGNNQYLHEVIFDNIIMNAPAVRAKEHGEVLSQIRMQDRLYVTLNERDRILRGAHLLTSGRMLGNLVMEPLADNTTYVDFSCVAGMQHTYFAGYHGFEFELPAFEQFYMTAIHGGQVDFSTGELFRQADGKPVYRLVSPDGDCP